MVLFGDSALNSVSSGAAIQYDKLSSYYDILYNKLCKCCEQLTMSSIPFSSFSAAHIRDTQRDMKVANITKNNGNTPKYFNISVKELSALQYNSKLMNSIWGIYNRYSPHNVKKVNDANAFNGEMQQSAAISPKDSLLSLPAAIEKIWFNFQMSQSH